MNDPIHECIAKFGPAPRALPLWDRLIYLRVPKPSWLRAFPSDTLQALFQNAPKLFTNGVVVWGHIIQANRLMFEAGNDDCPGELVYSLRDHERMTPEDLQPVAAKLFSLKGTKPTDPALAGIANYLTNETMRVFGLSVPPEVSPKLRCQISTTYFLRKHLPKRRLCTPLLPIVVNPKRPHVALPLPQKYWPQDFIDWWSQ